MELGDTPEEAAFRRECRAWLEANAVPRADRSGHEVLGVLGRAVDTDGELARARRWQQAAADAGWAGIHWPPEYGGRGAGLMQQVIWGQEASRFDVPDHIFRIGISLGGPTVIGHGTEEQKRRLLPPLLTGEEIWCQLFSEPGAGSDLASLRTTADRDGDIWRVNGQKVWSSGAHYSTWGLLLVRTDRRAPKHRGITYFLIDMATPGIEVRPLRQMTGAAHFCEVFFSDVEVPDHHRIGAVGEGWQVAQTTLLNERAMLGELGLGDVAEAVAGLARRTGVEHDRRVRQDLAEVHIHGELLRFIGYRIATAISQGRLPGAEASVAKLAAARALVRSSEVALQLAGAAGVAALDVDRELERWATMFLAAPAVRIAGGSDEVQRNIVAERVLGLPKGPGPDRETPFADLPHSA